MESLLPPGYDASRLSGGRGPVDLAPTSPFRDIPFAPFSRGEHINRAADWHAQRIAIGSTKPEKADVPTAFNTFTDDRDETGNEFETVDTRSVVRKPGYGQKRWQQFAGTGVRRVAGGFNWQAKSKPQQKQSQKRKKQWRQRYTSGTGTQKLQSSIDVDPSWGEPVAAFPFPSLASQSSPAPTGKTLTSRGELEKFNPYYSRITVRQEKALERNWAVDRTFYQVTPSQDPVLMDLMNKGEGDVFISDSILAVLMTTLKSVNSWDIVVRKKNGKIIFDKRDGSGIDLVSVNENSNQAPSEEDPSPANTASALTKEATFVNYNFSQQVLKKDGEVRKFEANPFLEEEVGQLASVAYHYRLFDLPIAALATPAAEEGAEPTVPTLRVVVRTEVDGYEQRGQKDVEILAKSLNEYDIRITGNWRQKLETQRAGMFATEVRNNGCKLSRWALQAQLAGASAIKLGYITRTSMRDPYSHIVLGVEDLATHTFMHDVGLDLSHAWGVFAHYLARIQQLDDGCYLFLRIPNEKVVSLYKVNEAVLEK